jgi:glycosyltransferase involved in cell wall biosynthesis
VNILICNNRYFPSTGPERYLFAVTRLLEQHGHRVVPLAADYAQTVDTPYRNYFVPPPVDGASVFYKQYAHQLTMRTRLELTARAAYYSAARAAATRAIEEQDIDLVYVLNTTNVLSPSVIDAGHRAKLPVVLRLSDFSLLCPAYTCFRAGRVCEECLGGYHHALRHRCLQSSLAVTSARVLAMTLHNALGIYRKVDAFVSPSRYLAERMEQFPAARGRIHYLPSFAEPALIANTETRDARSDSASPPMGAARPYFLYFGRLAPDKGVETLIRAYAQLDHEIDLVVAGTNIGGHSAQMKQLATSLDRPDVRFVGFVEGEALAALISGAVAVVVPSLWHDNAPMAVYESLWHGKAVIGSNLGGIAEQLGSGSGLLVAPGDPAELAAGMRQVASDSALRRRLEVAARLRARTAFAPERHYEGLMAVMAAAQSVRRRRLPVAKPPTSPHRSGPS